MSSMSPLSATGGSNHLNATGTEEARTGKARRIPRIQQDNPNGPSVLSSKILDNIIKILPLSDYSNFSKACMGFHAIQMRETELKDVKSITEWVDKAFVLLSKSDFFKSYFQGIPYHSDRWDPEIFEELQLEALQIWSKISEQVYSQNKLNQANVEILESLVCALDFADQKSPYSHPIGDKNTEAALKKGISLPDNFTHYQKLAFILADEIMCAQRFSSEAYVLSNILDQVIQNSGVKGLSKEALLDTYLKNPINKPPLSHLYFMLKSMNNNEEWINNKLRLALRSMIYTSNDKDPRIYECVDAVAWFGKGDISGSPENNAANPFGIHVFPRAMQEAFIHYTTQVLNSGKEGVDLTSRNDTSLSPQCAIDIMKLLQGMKGLKYLAFKELVNHSNEDWAFNDEHVPDIIDFIKNTPDLKTLDITIITRNPENTQLLLDISEERKIEQLAVSYSL